MEPELKREIDALQVQVDKLETETLLSGANDLLNAIITIHPGAGGTESRGLGRHAPAHVSALGGA